jgi:hypothetical protein
MYANAISDLSTSVEKRHVKCDSEHTGFLYPLWPCSLQLILTNSLCLLNYFPSLPLCAFHTYLRIAICLHPLLNSPRFVAPPSFQLFLLSYLRICLPILSTGLLHYRR